MLVRNGELRNEAKEFRELGYACVCITLLRATWMQETFCFLFLHQITSGCSLHWPEQRDEQDLFSLPWGHAGVPGYWSVQRISGSSSVLQLPGPSWAPSALPLGSISKAKSLIPGWGAGLAPGPQWTPVSASPSILKPGPHGALGTGGLVTVASNSPQASSLLSRPRDPLLCFPSPLAPQPGCLDLLHSSPQDCPPWSPSGSGDGWCEAVEWKGGEQPAPPILLSPDGSRQRGALLFLGEPAAGKERLTGASFLINMRVGIYVCVRSTS